MIKLFKDLLRHPSKALDNLLERDFIVITKPLEWYSSIRTALYQFKTGVVNIYQWFPIIWGDRWYDYTYILILLEKKFNLMVPKFQVEGHLENHLEVAHDLQQCSDICHRLINDEYLEEELEDLGKRYPIGMLESTPDENGRVQIQFIQSDIGRELFTELYKEREKLFLRDKSMLFALLSRNLTNFSD